MFKKVKTSKLFNVYEEINFGQAGRTHGSNFRKQQRLIKMNINNIFNAHLLNIKYKTIYSKYLNYRYD